MPKNVKNFWIELDIDGKSAPIKAGPRSKDGGFKMVIRQRDRDCSVLGAVISGESRPNGELRLLIKIPGIDALTFITSRN